MINAMLLTIIILSSCILLFLILMGLGMDSDKFKARFMRNPTRINVLHVKSGKIWSKLYNLKNGEKEVREGETSRLINWDYAYGHRGINNFYYVDDSAEPVKFDDFTQRLSSAEMQDLSILFMMAGATDYIPLLVKQIIQAILPWIIFALIFSLITMVLAGIGLSNTNQINAHMSIIEQSLKLVKNVTSTTLVG